MKPSLLVLAAQELVARLDAIDAQLAVITAHLAPRLLAAPPASAGELLSPKETARYTSLSRATIHRLRHAGQFPDPIRLSPGRVGWRTADVRAWLQTRHGQLEPLRSGPTSRRSRRSSTRK